MRVVGYFEGREVPRPTQGGEIVRYRVRSCVWWASRVGISPLLVVSSYQGGACDGGRSCPRDCLYAKAWAIEIVQRYGVWGCDPGGGSEKRDRLARVGSSLKSAPILGTCQNPLSPLRYPVQGLTRGSCLRERRGGVAVALVPKTNRISPQD
jgi:hypothetical protein